MGTGLVTTGSPVLYLNYIAALPEIALKPGEVLAAFVQAVREDSAVLYVKGAQLVVQPQVPLKEGEYLRLKVMDFQQDGQVMLKVLPEHQAGLTPAAPAGSWETALADLQAEASPQNLVLAKSMAWHGQPLTAEDLQFLAGHAAKWNLSPKELPALVWLWARGLPVNKSTVDLVASQSPMNRSEGLSLEKLSQLLASADLPPETGGDVAALTFLRQQITVGPEDTVEAFAGKLANLGHALGMDFEAQAAALIEQGKEETGPPAAAPGSGAAKEEAGKEPRLDFRQGLKPLLLHLGQLLAQSGEEEVSGQAIQLADRVTYLQLSSASQPGDTAPGLFLQGAALLRDTEVPFFLKVQEDPPGATKENDLPGHRVTIYTNTPRMGQIMVRLHLTGGVLNASLTVDRQATQRLINAHLPELTRQMQQLPWPVHLLPCRFQQGQAIQEGWARETGEYDHHQGVDLLI